MTGSEIGRLAWAREKHRRRQALGQRHHQPMRRHDNTTAWGSARVQKSSLCGSADGQDGSRKVFWGLGPAEAAVKSISLGLPHNMAG
jgi:hypothetical protein